METQQIYYLFSSDNENEELIDNYELIDPSHMNNFFELIKVNDNVYNIIKIYKNNGCNGKFKIGDVIYFEGGMVSFCTKNIDGKIDEIECLKTIVKEKEKITLYNEILDKKIDKIIDIIIEFENEYNNIDKKYINIKNALNFIKNN
jgi:hypothetical protein